MSGSRRVLLPLACGFGAVVLGVAIWSLGLQGADPGDGADEHAASGSGSDGDVGHGNTELANPSTSNAEWVAEAAHESAPSRIDPGSAEAVPIREVAPVEAATRFFGQVVDIRGAPAIGCEVQLRVAVETVDGWRFEEVATTKSEEEGRFDLEAPASRIQSDRSVVLIALRESEGAATASIVGRDRVGTVVERILRLEPATSGAVVVLDEQGRPFAGALVTPHGFPSMGATTDASGVARFPAVPVGKRGFSAVVHGRPAAHSIPDELKSGVPFSFQLALREGGTVSGRVVDRDDRPLPKSRVSIGGVAGALVTDRDGAYRADQVPIGRTTVRAHFAKWASAPLECEVPFDGVVAKIDVSCLFEGLVVDATGNAVEPDSVEFERLSGHDLRRRVEIGKPRLAVASESAGKLGVFEVSAVNKVTRLERVAAGEEGASRSMTQGPRADGIVRDGNGRFRLYSDSSIDPYFLIAKSAEHGIAVAGPFAPNERKLDVVLQFGERATLAVEVVDGLGTGIADARLEFRQEGHALFEARTDASGRYLATGLPRDEIVVVAHSDAGASKAQRVQVEFGKANAVRVEIDDCVTLFGVVRDLAGEPLPRARVYVLDSEIESLVLRETITDEHGEYRVGPVPRGQVVVRVSPDSSGILFGDKLHLKYRTGPRDVEVGAELEQRLDLTANWPARAQPSIEFRLDGAVVDAGVYEVSGPDLRGVYRPEGTPLAFAASPLSMPLVAPGTYVLSFRSVGGAWYMSKPVTIAPGSREVMRIDVATAPLTGIVENAVGQTIEGAEAYFVWNEVWRKQIDGGRAVSPFCDVDPTTTLSRTRSDGAFALPPGQLRAHTLVVSAKGYSTIFVPIDEELARRVPLRLRLSPVAR